MNQKDIRAKKSAIRKEIKDRTQTELDKRKKEIKRRIKREDISIEEKRRRYRQEVHEEKLRLMQRAKEEFIARKRMLGLSQEEELGAISEERRYSPSRSASYEEEIIEPGGGATDRFQILEEEDDEILRPGKYRAPEKGFVYSDYSDGEDDSERRRYEAPISESDVEPFEMELSDKAVADEHGLEFEEPTEAKGLFYYVINLFFHPVQALDEFDEYLASPSGLAKVALFYLVSLSPFVLYGMIAGNVSGHMPGGLIGNMVASAAPSQIDPILIVSDEILKLLLYSFSIAVVNYFVAGEGKFLTLTIYFAFVRAVTSLVVYTSVILAVFAVITIAAQPQLAGLVAGVAVMLLVAFIIWTFALNMIVLMSAYGYDLAIAFILSLAASFVSSIVTHIAMKEFGIYLF